MAMANGNHGNTLSGEQLAKRVMKLTLGMEWLAESLGKSNLFRFDDLFHEETPPFNSVNPQEYTLPHERDATNGRRFFTPCLNAIGNFRYLHFKTVELEEHLTECIPDVGETLVREARVTIGSVLTVLGGNDFIVDAYLTLANTSETDSNRRASCVRMIERQVKRADDLCSAAIYKCVAEIRNHCEPSLCDNPPKKPRKTRTSKNQRLVDFALKNSSLSYKQIAAQWKQLNPGADASEDSVGKAVRRAKETDKSGHVR